VRSWSRGCGRLSERKRNSEMSPTYTNSMECAGPERFDETGLLVYCSNRIRKLVLVSFSSSSSNTKKSIHDFYSRRAIPFPNNGSGVRKLKSTVRV